VVRTVNVDMNNVAIGPDPHCRVCIADAKQNMGPGFPAQRHRNDAFAEMQQIGSVAPRQPRLILDAIDDECVLHQDTANARLAGT
jgi:hypothetical protein